VWRNAESAPSTFNFEDTQQSLMVFFSRAEQANTIAVLGDNFGPISGATELKFTFDEAFELLLQLNGLVVNVRTMGSDLPIWLADACCFSPSVLSLESPPWSPSNSISITLRCAKKLPVGISSYDRIRGSLTSG
jgi:hypothetical protein